MKNIAIVGCNRGIGLALARKYTESHYSVFGFCRNTSNELRQLKIEKVIEDFDVINTKNHQKLIEKLPEKMDALIHVAGVLNRENLTHFDSESILLQFKCNSLGPLNTVKAFLPALKPEARIGLISSRMGSIEDNSSGGMYGYRMSKAALNMAGKSLALDLAPQNIAVLLLHPGYVKSDMTGGHGNVTTAESAEGLFQVFETKGMNETGTFWHMNGEQLPW